MKKIILIVSLLAFSNCSNLNKTYENDTTYFEKFIHEDKNINVNKEWWLLYKDTTLNNLINLGLQNNSDLAKAGISINKALYKANQLGAELYPTFETAIKLKNQLDTTTGTSKNSYDGSIGISYEIDLWKKIKDSKDAQEWEYKATVEDYEAIKLSLITNIIDCYFSINYLNETISIYQENLKNYEKIATIIDNKIKYGQKSEIDKDENNKQLLNAKNQLVNYNYELETQKILLKNLLNLKPSDNLEIIPSELLEIQEIGINSEIPLSIISNRPDIKSAEYRLKSAFKNAKKSEKNLYPNITLTLNSSSSGSEFKDSFKFDILMGSININLPFLDWNNIKWNVKIDRAGYEEAKINFEISITTALNEISLNYKQFLTEENLYKNLKNTLINSENIERISINRYNAGKIELMEVLNKNIDKNNSKINLLNSKYKKLKYENLLYKSFGCKYL